MKLQKVKNTENISEIEIFQVSEIEEKDIHIPIFHLFRCLKLTRNDLKQQTKSFYVTK